MPGDELQELRQFLSQPVVCTCSGNEILAGIFLRWKDAGFSDLSDDAMRRYYTWHLAEISRLADAPNVNGRAQPVLIQLIDHLFRYYPGYCDNFIKAPQAYRSRAKALSSSAFNKTDLEDSTFMPWLKKTVPALCDQPCTYARIKYLAELVAEISSGLTGVDDLIQLLIAFNFNHLDLYRTIANVWAGLPSDILRQKALHIRLTPERLDKALDLKWPSLKEMLLGWLQEQIATSPDRLSTNSKLDLNISVAYIALFLRLLRDEGIIVAENLTQLFAQVCTAVRTKKQPVISERSLSKEFYSTDQQTAARVRELLQKMILVINRKYFPLATGFVVGAMHLLLS